jgi:hypothetical protein
MSDTRDDSNQKDLASQSSKLVEEKLGSEIYKPRKRDRLNPYVWDALYLDRSIPVDLVSKAYMVRDLQSWSRNYLLMPIKVVANLLLGVIMTAKRLLPFQFSNYSLMHQSAAFFLNNFASPEACYLIVRHLCIGSNIINFLIDNGPDPQMEKSQLYPHRVQDLVKNAFLEHDITLYNFILDYNEAEQANPQWVEQVKKRGISYDSIQPIKVDVDVSKGSWLKIIDLESAIELFKVFYSLCLTSDEFAKAVLSLQFDENFGLYISKITEDYKWNHVITNRHPLAPNSPFSAARDLFLHGIMAESLHRYLEVRKQLATD